MDFASMNTRERALALAAGMLLLAALLGPALPTPAAFASVFADTRAWGRLPNAMDVLSNLPFALLGLIGLRRLQRIDAALNRAQSRHWRARGSATVNARDCAWLFFAGLIVTAIGSVLFHLHPDAHSLAADRAGMTVAFAGLIGMALCERVSQRSGWPAAWLVLLAGLAAVEVCRQSGNVLPWALVQFGGMALLVVLAFLAPLRGTLGLRLGWVIAIYALAKLFELGDQAIYQASGQLISGHTLKHLTAACAALPVLQSLGGLRALRLRHNRAAAAATA